jgi:uncharacterized protein YbjT (DUF2867 family)
MNRFPSHETILVTGATGTIGSLLVEALSKEGARVRAMAHSQDKAAVLSRGGIETVTADFEQRETLNKALAGVQRVFLLTPSNPRADIWAGNVIAAAGEAGQPYIVRLSVAKAAPDAPTDNTRRHYKTEEDLRASGLPYAILRPHYFMQNLLRSAGAIASEGALHMGMGEARMGMIDVRDIVDSAVQVLADRTYSGRIYTLTGPASITLHTVAKALSDAIGRPVQYAPVPPEAVRDSILKMGGGQWLAEVMRDYARAYAAGWGDYTTDTVHTLTGHGARSIEQFAREVFAPALEHLRERVPA